MVLVGTIQHLINNMNIQKIISTYGEKNISIEQFDDIFDMVIDETLEQLKAFPKYIPPTLFIIESVDNEELKNNKELFQKIILEREFEFEPNKDLSLTLLGASFVPRKIIPLTLFFVAEAYRKETEMKDKIKELGNQPSEIVIVSGMTIDGRSNMAVFPIKRSKNNKMQPLVDMKIWYAKDGKLIPEEVLQNIYMGFFRACEENSVSDLLKNHAKTRS